MAVIRTPLPHSAFTMVRNCWARDRRIGYKGRGLLSYLLSHADGYKISQAQIVRESTDGREAVRTGLDELEAAGYLTRTKQRSSGRFAEDDYALADPFDGSGVLLPGMPETGEAVAARLLEIRQRRKSDTVTGGDYPTRETAPLEEQGEKITPAPTEQGVDGDGRHLRPVDGLTVNQRVKILTDEHYEACGGLENWNAVAGLVRKALNGKRPDGAPRTDDDVRRALTFLRNTHRTPNGPLLRAALDSPQTVTSNGRRNNYGPGYLNPDPRTDPHAFDGGF